MNHMPNAIGCLASHFGNDATISRLGYGDVCSYLASECRSLRSHNDDPCMMHSVDASDVRMLVSTHIVKANTQPDEPKHSAS